jgi:hypothetical protein
VDRHPVTVIERIGDDWRNHTGHTDRYQWAADRTYRYETVIDVACGIGYGSTFFTGRGYHGYDRPGVPVESFPGVFHDCDLNDPLWRPVFCDVALCFETLEHVEQPAELATTLSLATRRAIFVSAPTQPTRANNPYHLHDFTVDDIPPMFPDFNVFEVWAQPEELSHVWFLIRRP